MIDLREHRDPLLRFLEVGLMAFRRSHPSDPIGHVALYCCPWRGWVSLCLDSAAHYEQNCPDFAYGEIASYQAEAWTVEYDQAASPTLTTLAGQTVVLDLESKGDEAINEEFFEFLRALLQAPEAEAVIRAAAGGSSRVGVQLLDSAFSHSWCLGA